MSRADLQIERILPAPSDENQCLSTFKKPDGLARKGYKNRFEGVLCTGDGYGAAVSWKVMGGSACGIALQALKVLKVGGPPPL